MLTRFDDFPIHQTPEPIAHPASTDRNVYDRYWFNGYSADGNLYFGIAFGLYPNRSVMDCAFSVVVNGVQRSFYASRRAPWERDELQIGPLRIEIVVPMQTVKVTLADNETGLGCTLTFSARTIAIEEERQVLKREGRVFMDVTRFTQFGFWDGIIRCDGQSIQVQGKDVYATRDRSWGVRPVGESPGGARPKTPPQVFFLWAPIHWDEMCTHAFVFEDSTGRQLNGEGKIVRAFPAQQNLAAKDGADVRRMAGVSHKLVYEPSTRRAQSGEIIMHEPSGQEVKIAFEPIMRFQMKGIGYRHPQWSHGVWKGELEIGADSWTVGSLDPLLVENVHIQQVVRARMGDKIGYGVVEQLCVGPHTPSGFSRWLDGAK
jgi:hypothetical protein